MKENENCQIRLDGLHFHSWQIVFTYSLARSFCWPQIEKEKELVTMCLLIRRFMKAHSKMAIGRRYQSVHTNISRSYSKCMHIFPNIQPSLTVFFFFLLFGSFCCRTHTYTILSQENHSWCKDIANWIYMFSWWGDASSHFLHSISVSLYLPLSSLYVSISFACVQIVCMYVSSSIRQPHFAYSNIRQNAIHAFWSELHASLHSLLTFKYTLRMQKQFSRFLPFCTVAL